MFSQLFTQHPDFGLQLSNPFFEVRTWFRWLNDEPTDPVSRFGQIEFLQLTVGAAGGHHGDIMALSENTGRRQLVSGFELPGTDLSSQVIEDAKVWLSFRHEATVHDVGI
ncbi:hypothetical protein GCM10007147_45010 [Nocardiopsis kunsanensis]|uniref:Uncharacterized protein n=1 Tax=Nocardiopsis kunsanensis TaxID=141693 RepID=A0A918XL42_9ACTN|nr:hypothetical protein [Nocardiopsis kunsanensis]GHD37165.1 hypothetical protein GCM10007147_45010 [Nocardiopsis kunsanensis]